MTDNYETLVEKVLREVGPILRELVKAMRDYEMDVDEPSPERHRAMMARAEALLGHLPEEAKQ